MGVSLGKRRRIKRKETDIARLEALCDGYRLYETLQMFRKRGIDRYFSNG